MKKYIKSLLILSILLGSFTACDLERFPYDAIETGQSFQTIKMLKTGIMESTVISGRGSMVFTHILRTYR